MGKVEGAGPSDELWIGRVEYSVLLSDSGLYKLNTFCLFEFFVREKTFDVVVVFPADEELWQWRGLNDRRSVIGYGGVDFQCMPDG